MPVPPGARPNAEFHRLLMHFVNQETLCWRDKRVADVIRQRSFDPNFGSIAIVRRAGLDLRTNLKFASFGHLNVLQVEVMQVLDEAYRILGADDVKRLFGADNAWDVVEEVCGATSTSSSSPRRDSRWAFQGARSCAGSPNRTYCRPRVRSSRPAAANRRIR
jgi:hypothetical protein